jgi:predicted DNA-binding ribbon-helix-helix protein
MCIYCRYYTFYDYKYKKRRNQQQNFASDLKVNILTWKLTCQSLQLHDRHKYRAIENKKNREKA